MYKNYNMTQLTLPMETSVLIRQMIFRHVNDIVETILTMNSTNSDITWCNFTYHPKMMLKVILYAYTQSVYSQVVK